MVDAVSDRAIVLLNENPSILAGDKKIIRDVAGSGIVALTSGCTAAKHLADNPRSAEKLIVVVGERLRDMTGEQFCHIVRLHPNLRELPLLLLVDSDARKDEMQTFGAQASSILARPFSSETLRSSLHKAALNPGSQRTTEPDPTRFYAYLENPEILLKPSHRTPEEWYKVGLQCLQQKKGNSAISAFLQALPSKTVQGEAELGLAAAYTGKNDLREAGLWLLKATESMIRGERWANARSIFARARHLDEQCRNPFFILARKNIYQGNYEKAANILAEGSTTEQWMLASEKIAALCALAGNPKSMLAQTKQALLHRRTQKNANAIDVLLTDMTERFRQKMLQARDVAKRAQSQRTEELSKRLEDLQVQTKSLPDTQTDAPTDTQKTTQPPPLPNDLGLLALPGDAAKAPPPQLAFPAARHASFVGDILRVIKATWRLMRTL